MALHRAVSLIPVPWTTKGKLHTYVFHKVFVERPTVPDAAVVAEVTDIKCGDTAAEVPDSVRWRL
jgi:hypothetical protein